MVSSWTLSSRHAGKRTLGSEVAGVGFTCGGDGTRDDQGTDWWVDPLHEHRLLFIERGGV